MSTNEPTPEPDPDHPGADGGVGDELDVDIDADATRRQPPGPDDVPLSNLPPPTGGPDGGPNAPDQGAPEAVAGPLDDADEEVGDEQVDLGAGAAGDEPAVVGDAAGEEADVVEGISDRAGLDEPATDGSAPDEELPDERRADERWADERWADLGEPFEPEGDLAAEDHPEPADGEEPDATAAVGAVPSARHVSRLTAAAVLVAVLAGGLALAKAQQVGDLTTQRDDRRSIERVAAAFGSAYLSYDFTHAEASGRAVQALATTAFAKAYAAQSAPGIQELFSSRQTTTKATTTEVFVGGVGAKRARALVVVDVTATSPTDGEQRLDDVSFVLDLDRTTGGWRVAKVARAPQPVLDQPTTTQP